MCWQKQTVTVRDLFTWAQKHNLADAPIRISDGMAVSYYPMQSCLLQGVYEVNIDVSGIEPIEYDELPDHAKRVRL